MNWIRYLFIAVLTINQRFYIRMAWTYQVIGGDWKYAQIRTSCRAFFLVLIRLYYVIICILFQLIRSMSSLFHSQTTTFFKLSSDSNNNTNNNNSKTIVFSARRWYGYPTASSEWKIINRLPLSCLHFIFHKIAKTKGKTLLLNLTVRWQ